jgi:hypothetical protein
MKKRGKKMAGPQPIRGWLARDRDGQIDLFRAHPSMSDCGSWCGENMPEPEIHLPRGCCVPVEVEIRLRQIRITHNSSGEYWLLLAGLNGKQAGMRLEPHPKMRVLNEVLRAVAEEV